MRHGGKGNMKRKKNITNAVNNDRLELKCWININWKCCFCKALFIWNSSFFSFICQSYLFIHFAYICCASWDSINFHSWNYTFCLTLQFDRLLVARWTNLRSIFFANEMHFVRKKKQPKTWILQSEYKDDSNWLLIIEIENKCKFFFHFYFFFFGKCTEEEEQKCEIFMDWSCQPNDVGCKRKHVCQSKLNALWRNFKLQPCKCRINKFQNTQTDYSECNSRRCEFQQPFYALTFLKHELRPNVQCAIFVQKVCRIHFKYYYWSNYLNK